VSFGPKPGEQVIYRGRPSWRGMVGIFLRALVIGVVLALVTGLLGTAAYITFLAILLPLLVAFGLGMLRRLGTVYTITSQRLNIRRGTFAREIQETRLDRIHRIGVAQSPLQRALKVGDVVFDTASNSGNELVFEGVGDPAGVAERVNRAASLSAAA